MGPWAIRRVWALAACVAWAAAGCNGVGAPPPAPGSGSTQPSGQTTEPSAATESESPDGQPQKGLPLGKVVLTSPKGHSVQLTVEIADTDSSRQTGLMFRESLGFDEGMLFIFPDERPRSFWMRNTLISLDMFFIDSSFEVIGVVESAEPLTETPRRVEGEAQYVLEVNGGFAAEHGFGAGTKVQYTPPEAEGRETQ